MPVTIPANRYKVPYESRMVFAITGIDGAEGAVMQLWIPPNQLEIQTAKRINRYLTRGAWIEEHWGEQLDTLTGSGSTGMWMHDDCGLVAGRRGETKAYWNFEDFLSMYRNNAAEYNTRGKIIKQGQIYVYFQWKAWLGYFESFNDKETDKSPFRFELDFVFKAQKTAFGIA